MISAIIYESMFIFNAQIIIKSNVRGFGKSRRNYTIVPNSAHFIKKKYVTSYQTKGFSIRGHNDKTTKFYWNIIKSQKHCEVKHKIVHFIKNIIDKRKVFSIRSKFEPCRFKFRTRVVRCTRADPATISLNYRYLILRIWCLFRNHRLQNLIGYFSYVMNINLLTH